MKRREFIRIASNTAALMGIPCGGYLLESAIQVGDSNRAIDHGNPQEKAASFLELPAELELTSTEIRGGEWTKNAIIVQPWGKTQIEIMSESLTGKPQRLQESYGFNSICVLPPEALAAVGGGQQSEAAFVEGVTGYRTAGYKIILYSSLVNMGHDPAWYEILREHPEWRQVDPSGRSANWLCPNNAEVLERAITYTKKLIHRYHADGVMFDNNGFNIITTRAPACYCQGCKEKFRAYVASRFGDQMDAYYGVAATNIELPRTPGPLYSLWKYWRCRSWAVIMEHVRQSLPGTVLFANTQYGYWTEGDFGWFLGDDLVYSHEDMVLGECYNMTPRSVSSKMNLGCALAQGRPLLDVVGTFQWNPPDYARLKPPGVILRLVAASLLHNANPWVVYYGLEGDDSTNALSQKALSRILLFRARHPDLYTNAQVASSVCSILPLESYTQLGTGHPVVPKHVAALADAGITTVGVCDLNLHSEKLSRFGVVVAEHASCLDAAGARNLAQWIQAGGILITTADLGMFDEVARARPRSIVADDLGIGRLSTQLVGKGIVQVVQPDKILSKVLQFAGGNIEALNIASHCIEFRAYVAEANKILLHIINYSSPIVDNWNIRLPSTLASGITEVTLYCPDTPRGVRLKCVGQQIEVPAIDTYAVITMVCSK